MVGLTSIVFVPPWWATRGIARFIPLRLNIVTQEGCQVPLGLLNFLFRITVRVMLKLVLLSLNRRTVTHFPDSPPPVWLHFLADETPVDPTVL